MRRPRRRLRGPWEEYAIVVLLEKGIGTLVDLASARATARLEEWRRHASGEAEREFVKRFDAALDDELEHEDEEDDALDAQEEDL